MVQLDNKVEPAHLQMQLTISKWEYLIRIMGDCMAPGKRAGYIVNYECKQGKWKFPKPGK